MKTLLHIKIILFAGIFLVIPGMALNALAQHDHAAMQQQMSEKGREKGGAISYYTCGMHPSVHVSVEEYKKGSTHCPICSMPLVPVKKTSMDKQLDEGVIDRLELTLSELKLAGVQTVPVERKQLFKEIRAVGTVAYDPQLAIAQDEFVSAVKSYRKAKQGTNQEVIGRSESLVESSRKKLFLLGLSQDQIDQLAKTLQIEKNLTSSENQMWIYGDVFEYELDWVRKGAHVVARPISLPGEEFKGEIVSINPVVDPATRSLRFRALVNNSKGELKPEMYVDIEIFSSYKRTDGETEVLAIPKNALLDTGRRRIVWVDLQNGQFEGRSVKVGPEAVDNFESANRYYPVLEGLKEGERVVTKGNFLIDSQSQIMGTAASSYSGSLEGNSGHDMPGMPGM